MNSVQFLFASINPAWQKTATSGYMSFISHSQHIFFISYKLQSISNSWFGLNFANIYIRAPRIIFYIDFRFSQEIWIVVMVMCCIFSSFFFCSLSCTSKFSYMLNVENVDDHVSQHSYRTVNIVSININGFIVCLCVCVVRFVKVGFSPLQNQFKESKIMKKTFLFVSTFTPHFLRSITLQVLIHIFLDTNKMEFVSGTSIFGAKRMKMDKNLYVCTL